MSRAHTSYRLTQMYLVLLSHPTLFAILMACSPCVEIERVRVVPSICHKPLDSKPTSSSQRLLREPNVSEVLNRSNAVCDARHWRLLFNLRLRPYRRTLTRRRRSFDALRISSRGITDAATLTRIFLGVFLPITWMESSEGNSPCTLWLSSLPQNGMLIAVLSIYSSAHPDLELPESCDIQGSSSSILRAYQLVSSLNAVCCILRPGSTEPHVPIIRKTLLHQFQLYS